MAHKRYRLVVEAGDEIGTVYPLEGEEIYIGRDEANDIVIADPEVSRHHARLRRRGETFTVEDLGSTNGTFVDARRVTAPTPLKNGSEIQLGPFVTLIFEEIAVAEAANSPTDASAKRRHESGQAKSVPLRTASRSRKWIWPTLAIIVLALALIAIALR